MKVFAFWDSSPAAHPEQAEFFRLWELTWRRRGWEPRILTARQAKRNPKYSRVALHHDTLYFMELALESAGGKWICSPRTINFSLAPPKDLDKWLRSRVTARLLQGYNRPGWQKSPLVFFELAADVLTCGRPL
jgi:hypothetical protein